MDICIFVLVKKPPILITKKVASPCLQVPSMKKMVFKPLSEKYNKATASHNLESIPPLKQFQIFPIVILLHVPSKNLCRKDGYTAHLGSQLNHEPLQMQLPDRKLQRPVQPL